MSQNGGDPERPTGDDQAAAWNIVGYLLSALIVWGGVGWLLDHFLHTSFCLPLGILVGAVAGVYLVYIRYGRT